MSAFKGSVTGRMAIIIGPLNKNLIDLIPIVTIFISVYHLIVIPKDSNVIFYLT